MRHPLTVPDGVFAGMDMAVEWDGVTYNIAVLGMGRGRRSQWSYRPLVGRRQPRPRPGDTPSPMAAR